MSYQFEFRDEKIVTDFRFFMFEEFTDIWTKDRSKDKVKANRLLRFIFLLCDIGKDNPIKDVDISKRESEAKFRAFRDIDRQFTDDERDLLEPAIKLYTELNMVTEERLLEALDEKAEQLGDVLENTVPETVTNVENGVVSYASNSKIITDGLSKLSKIRTNREKIVAAIKKQAITQKVRGGLTLSPLVRGLLKPKAK
jgi:hypothetical protein